MSVLLLCAILGLTGAAGDVNRNGCVIFNLIQYKSIKDIGKSLKSKIVDNVPKLFLVPIDILRRYKVCYLKKMQIGDRHL